MGPQKKGSGFKLRVPSQPHPHACPTPRLLNLSSTLNFSQLLPPLEHPGHLSCLRLLTSPSTPNFSLLRPHPCINPIFEVKALLALLLVSWGADGPSGQVCCCASKIKKKAIICLFYALNYFFLVLWCTPFL